MCDSIQEVLTNITNFYALSEHRIREIAMGELTSWKFDSTIFTNQLVYRLELCKIWLRYVNLNCAHLLF